MIRTIAYSGETGVSVNIDLAKVYCDGDGHCVQGDEQYSGLLWVDIESPTTEEYNLLEQQFKFHYLTIEDCRNLQNRTKIDEYSGYSFLILQALLERNKRNRLEFAELKVYLGENYLITVHHQPISLLTEVYERCQLKQEILSRGVSFLFYNVLDSLVDRYLPFFDTIDDDVERLEEMIFQDPAKEHLNELFQLRRQLVVLRRVLSPLRDILNLLLNPGTSPQTEKHRAYFLDIYDHVLRSLEMLENFHDLLNGLFEMYLSLVSNRLNEVMKTLTIIATIFMPLTFVAGIYGMNFEHMPELKWGYGYYFSLGIMGIITGLMLVFFRKKKWL
ncbi:MAG: magnesium/cobalt transporter CorA [Carboxydocellales bacterium]